jgi:hypothetical protein
MALQLKNLKKKKEEKTKLNHLPSLFRDYLIKLPSIAWISKCPSPIYSSSSLYHIVVPPRKSSFFIFAKHSLSPTGLPLLKSLFDPENTDTLMVN